MYVCVLLNLSLDSTALSSPFVFAYFCLLPFCACCFGSSVDRRVLFPLWTTYPFGFLACCCFLRCTDTSQAVILPTSSHIAFHTHRAPSSFFFLRRVLCACGVVCLPCFTIIVCLLALAVAFCCCCLLLLSLFRTVHFFTPFSAALSLSLSHLLSRFDVSKKEKPPH